MKVNEKLNEWLEEEIQQFTDFVNWMLKRFSK